MSEIQADLDKAIAAAVQAKIEAGVLEALSGDQMFGRMVTAALQAPVTKDRNYRSTTKTYMQWVLEEAIQKAAAAAVGKFIADMHEELEAEVGKALRRDAKQVAEVLVKSLVATAEKPYGINVAVELKMPSRD